MLTFDGFTSLSYLPPALDLTCSITTAFLPGVRVALRQSTYLLAYLHSLKASLLHISGTGTASPCLHFTHSGNAVKSTATNLPSAATQTPAHLQYSLLGRQYQHSGTHTSLHPNLPSRQPICLNYNYLNQCLTLYPPNDLSTTFLTRRLRSTSKQGCRCPNQVQEQTPYSLPPVPGDLLLPLRICPAQLSGLYLYTSMGPGEER